MIPDPMIIHTPKFGGVSNAVHPDTVKFVYELNETVLHLPSHCGREGIASQFITQIDGTRIAENDRTDGRSTSFVRNGIDVSRTELTEYVANGLFGLNFIYPIFDWTDAEVWSYICFFQLDVSEEYRDYLSTAS